MQVGEKLLTLRKQKNISQEQLAIQLNIAQQAISDWETGISLPNIENIIQLSEVLDVTTDYLLKQAPSASTNPCQAEWWNEYVSNETTTAEHNTRGDKKYDLVYPLSFVVYLIIGFGFGWWHPGWLVFPAAWAIEEIGDMAILKKSPIELYGLASVVFFAMGFFFELWRFAWIAYVVAFFIEAVTTSSFD